jgi:hypothetical protein
MRVNKRHAAKSPSLFAEIFRFAPRPNPSVQTSVSNESLTNGFCKGFENKLTGNLDL